MSNAYRVYSFFVVFVAYLLLSACSMSAGTYDLEPTVLLEFSTDKKAYNEIRTKIDAFSKDQNLKFRISDRDTVFKKPNSFYYLAKNKNVMVHSSVGLNENFIIVVNSSRIPTRRFSNDETKEFAYEFANYFRSIETVKLVKIEFKQHSN